MTHPLLERLASGPVLADGAMGTMLYAGGASLDESFDALNLSQPELVLGVHRAYLDAGADLIEANTFGANRFKLEAFGLADRVREINRKGVRLAREAREIAGSSALVAGAVGPTGRTLAPFGTVAPEAARAAFREQIEALLEGGVDLLILETMGNLDESVEAVRAAREVCDLPIVASMTFAEDGRTIGGSSPVEVADRLRELGVAAIGANCSVGPQRLLPVIETIASRLCDLPGPVPVVSCMPNAGWPAQIAGRVIYPSSPEYFAEFAHRAVDAGARIIGGCCGTTPQHTAAMREALARQLPGDGGICREDEPDVATAEGKGRTRIVAVPEIDLVAGDEPTLLRQKLDRGEFVVSVEIDPPKGLNPTKALDGARLLQEAGVDLINVADSPMARVRMSALTLCYLIQHQVGVETILHLTTRDRSLMGLQSELLGAHAVGVRNIIALTGDPPSLGDYPDSSAVYDVDSIGLIRVLQRLNAGADSAGASIGRPAGFTIACAIDPTRADLELEAERLRAKLDAGAHLVMTQPIYDPATWRRFLEIYGVDRLPVPVLAGILPLQSSRHAEFLHNEVPGITLSDEARERMRRAGPDGRREGVKMAQELLLELQPLVQGVYLMPSFGRYEVAAEVLEVVASSPAGV
ncbi:MAG: bifunctional homocysteine S-methyltransferase/methylenetetrahydrofolate reductase [Thermomicrobiales bacterium]|nr:bifunctional homocysteine S-methyltransferase/methylenetetrahydrofolate reductase [Thermomicrobiales bacterium]